MSLRQLIKKTLKEHRSNYTVYNFENSEVKMLNKLLNYSLKKKYDWFIEIKILFVHKRDTGVQTPQLSGIFIVDEDWYGKKWREYHYSSPIPDTQIEDVQIGDIIGGKLASELSDEFKTILSFVFNDIIERFQWHNIFIRAREKNNDVITEETEERKLNLVKKMIYTFYDNISFIEQSTFKNKPLLKIYFDSEDTAANIESWFDEKISRDIDEWTSGGIVVCPEWAAPWDYRTRDTDVYINTELLKYDNLVNVINESILMESLPARIKRRISPDELEKEFLESFDSAYKLTKKRRISFRFFLEELIFSTITTMMDSFHPIFTNTLPENEFWYDDIFNDLKEHYEERIIKMYNEIMGINN